LRSPRGRVDYELERSIKKTKFVDDTVPLAACEFVRIEMAAVVAIGVGRYLTQTLFDPDAI
tara:strand:- start:19826 stop:20008 length:183 start_codon:yes stop_codon:yes gene_type:complete